MTPPGQPPVEGVECVRAFLRGMMGQMEIEVMVASESVVVDGNLAYDRGSFTGTGWPTAASSRGW